MRKLFLVYLATTLYSIAFTQDAEVRKINSIVNAKIALEPFRYLASDELKGRNTKRPEIHIAAKYIANFFKSNGIRATDGAKNYFQTFEIRSVIPPTQGSLQVGNYIFDIKNELLQAGGGDVMLNAPIVFAGYANQDELAKLDVKGKIVLSSFGRNDSSSPEKAYANIQAKQALLKEKGALAVIEHVWQKNASWNGLRNMFGEDRLVERNYAIPVFLLHGADSGLIASLASSPNATLTSKGYTIRPIQTENVVGWVGGSDPKLKDEYVVLSAHYDHLGVAKQPKIIDGKVDSIYNGARDNAIGVACVMNAARYFAKHPPKRSVLFILFTAEEIGLVGSKYYAERPIIPMKQIVFNLNCDNGGYNDTSLVTVIGLGRTSADNDIQKAAAAYGVRAIADPMPQQNLFDRSDNLNFAIAGVPAPTYGMGVTAFDSTIRQYYHQPADEVGSFNLDYGLKYIRSYILAAQNVASNPTQPTWIKGDKYEEAWIRLHGAQK